ncbi:MAG: SEC-C domain-containing protein, partial [Gammaproteobacteria bacterium]|nr:SEC-C domain-containing protein [Gammaproteobacteria bacterium]
NELLHATDVAETIHTLFADVVNGLIDTHIPPQSVEEQWDIPALMESMEREFAIKLDIRGWLDTDTSLHEETLRKKIIDEFIANYKAKEQLVGTEGLRSFEKGVLLAQLDNLWREHLANMDYLRQGIHLRGYAQVDPKREYKREAFEMFARMLDRLKYEVVSILAKVQVRTQEDVAAAEEQRRRVRAMQFQHAEAPSAASGAVPQDETQPQQQSPSVTTFVREGRKVGRNEPCPCGSGLKYKQCHGRLS